MEKLLERKKEIIKNGFRACLEEELILLEEASKTGIDFVTEDYFKVLRVSKKYLPEEEIRKYKIKYDEINKSYWENKRRNELD